MERCTEFRARLGAALEGRPSQARGELEVEGQPLVWHEHLFTCGACRELLAAEEALDELLASLPSPQLPVALARRVLERLAERGVLPGVDSLDRRLDDALDLTLGRGSAAPAGLGRRVLAGLAEARADQRDPEVRLDALLERLPEPELPADLTERVLAGVELERLLDRLPMPAVPTGLAERVLIGLQGERSSQAPEAAPILRPRFGRRLAAAAAVVLLLVAGRLLIDGRPGDTSTLDREGDGSSVRVATHEREGGAQPGETGALVAPEAELLEALDLLEDWELLMAEDVDLLLGSLDDADRELLLLGGSEEEQG
jgi:hypothetical protein